MTADSAGGERKRERTERRRSRVEDRMKKEKGSGRAEQVQSKRQLEAANKSASSFEFWATSLSLSWS